MFKEPDIYIVFVLFIILIYFMYDMIKNMKLEHLTNVSKTPPTLVARPASSLPPPIYASPIAGGWTDWQTTCDNSTCQKINTRSCTNPTPQNGGSPCVGNTVQSLGDRAYFCDNYGSCNCNYNNYAAEVTYNKNDGTIFQVLYMARPEQTGSGGTPTAQGQSNQSTQQQPIQSIYSGTIVPAEAVSIKLIKLKVGTRITITDRNDRVLYQNTGTGSPIQFDAGLITPTNTRLKFTCT